MAFLTEQASDINLTIHKVHSELVNFSKQMKLLDDKTDTLNIEVLRINKYICQLKEFEAHYKTTSLYCEVLNKLRFEDTIQDLLPRVQNNFNEQTFSLFEKLINFNKENGDMTLLKQQFVFEFLNHLKTEPFLKFGSFLKKSEFLLSHLNKNLNLSNLTTLESMNYLRSCTYRFFQIRVGMLGALGEQFLDNKTCALFLKHFLLCGGTDNLLLANEEVVNAFV